MDPSEGDLFSSFSRRRAMATDEKLEKRLPLEKWPVLGDHPDHGTRHRGAID